jgi:hypothetical protein
MENIMEYKFADMSLELSKDCARGVLYANGKRLLTEAKVDRIEPSLIISVYPKEHEPPHFLISTKDKQSCRFDLKTFQPIDELPGDIQKYKCNIAKFFEKEENKNKVIQKYNEMRPSDTPPQSLYC